MVCLDINVSWDFTHRNNCKKKQAIEAGSKGEFTCHADRCSLSCERHNLDPSNAPIINKRKDEMAKRGWPMGFVTIMEAFPINPKATGAAVKPGTNQYKASTAGLG